MLGTVEDAVRFVQLRLGMASPRSFQLDVVSRFIGVGQITWLGVCADTICSFERKVLELKLGKGVKGDWRCETSSKLRLVDLLLKLFIRREDITQRNLLVANLRQVMLVAEEDDQFIDMRDKRPNGSTVRAGEQCENIRLLGLDLVEVPLGSTLFFISPLGEISPATLFVTGSHGNALALMVRSSSQRGNLIRTGWFVAAFRNSAN